MARKVDNRVLDPTLGLYLARRALDVPLRGLVDGDNFRIQEGELTNQNIGYQSTSVPNLDGHPVMEIFQFRTRELGDLTVFATTVNLYNWDGTDLVYINPIYATGTIEVALGTETTVTGTGTLWDTGTPKNAKAGDFIAFGAADENDPAATWYEIASVDSDTQLTLTTAATVQAALTTYTIRKVYTGDLDDTWEMEPFINGPANTDWLYMTNGKDTITRWDGAGPSVYSAVGFTCKHLAAAFNQMLYANIVQSGNTLPVDMINSNIGDPEDVSTGISEQFKVHDDAGEIQRMLPLGDVVVIYSKRNVTLAQFAGDPLVYIFRKAVSDAGPVSSRLVLDFGDYHEFLSTDAMYRFDGASITPNSDHIWKTIIRNLDPSRVHQSHAFIVEEQGEAMWAVTQADDSGDGPEKALTEHYIEQLNRNNEVPYSRRNYPFLSTGIFNQQSTLTWNEIADAWDDYSGSWNDIFQIANFPLVYAGDAEGNIFQINSGVTADGVALNSFVRFGRRPSGDGNKRGLIWRVYPYARDINGTQADLNVYLHVADHAQGTTTEWGPFPFSLALPEGEHFVTPRHRGRFFEVEFRMNSTSGSYGINGYDYEGRRGGYR